ncbi:hypothetical protein ACTXT7_008348 [Hymenolepis weldensis]
MSNHCKVTLFLLLTKSLKPLYSMKWELGLKLSSAKAKSFIYHVPQNIYRIPPSFIALPPREIIHSQGRPFKVPCAASGHPQPSLCECFVNIALLSKIN